MANTLDQFPTAATTVGDTDLMHVKVGTGVNSDKKITGANVKALFATAAQGTTADAALPKAGGEMSGNITMAAAETVDGRDLSADGTVLDTIKDSYLGQNLQTGTTYTLVLGDAGKIVEMNNAAANTLTIPANASVAFPVDTRIDIVQYGAGQTTIAITTDTLRGNTKTAAQYNMVSLWKRASTEWVVIGGTT